MYILATTEANNTKSNLEEEQIHMKYLDKCSSITGKVIFLKERGKNHSLGKNLDLDLLTTMPTSHLLACHGHICEAFFWFSLFPVCLQYPLADSCVCGQKNNYMFSKRPKVIAKEELQLFSTFL